MTNFLYQAIMVTPAYSNALFQATFPIHADFHHRLHGTQLVPAMIQKVIVPNSYPDTCVTVVLTNGTWQWMARGMVDSYRHPRDYFFREWREPYEHFYGPSLISTNEAFQLASNTVRRLGYSMEQFATNWSPVVSGPFMRDGNNVPFISYRWQPSDDEWEKSEIHVDMENKRITYIFFPGHIRKEEPKISIVPETAKAYRERMKQTNGVLRVPSKP